MTRKPESAQPRKGMPSPRLGEDEFKRRFLDQFQDTAGAMDGLRLAAAIRERWPDSRHGVYTAEADRTAFGKLVCAETLRPEGYPYGGGTFPIAETTFLSSSSNALAEKLRNSGSDARPLIEAYR